MRICTSEQVLTGQYTCKVLICCQSLAIKCIGCRHVIISFTDYLTINMAVKNYAFVLCLVAVTISIVCASSTTSVETTSISESTVTTSEATTTAATTAATASTTSQQVTTTIPTNISCHQFGCESEGCVKEAVDNSTTDTCYTSGKCFAKKISNTTYTKEEVGCEPSDCSTTPHNVGDAKRACCGTNKCNNGLAMLTPNSLAPSTPYLMGIIFHFVIFVFKLSKYL